MKKFTIGNFVYKIACLSTGITCIYFYQGFHNLELEQMRKALLFNIQKTNHEYYLWCIMYWFLNKYKKNCSDMAFQKKTKIEMNILLIKRSIPLNYPRNYLIFETNVNILLWKNWSLSLSNSIMPKILLLRWITVQKQYFKNIENKSAKKVYLYLYFSIKRIDEYIHNQTEYFWISKFFVTNQKKLEQYIYLKTCKYNM